MGDCPVLGRGGAGLPQATLLGKMQIPGEPRDLASRRVWGGSLGSRDCREGCWIPPFLDPVPERASQCFREV